jgi:hypothetical protein
MRQKRTRAPRTKHGAAGSSHPASEFEWIAPDAIRALIEEGGGGMDMVMLNLETRERILAIPSDLHYLISGWLGWWQRREEAVECLVCEGDAAPYEGLPPAVLVMRLTPREVVRDDGDPTLEVPMLVHGVCAACAAKPDTVRFVCDEIQRTLFPDAVRVEAENALHMMPYGGRA